ncbi:MAG TPA: GFA family protein [Candidatus Binataceae bacterium]|nr:GFA family protein [Candidatus Binataceae bacterium]
MSKISGLKTYSGGCHCGKVRFEATAPLEFVDECNCSICTKKAYLHWVVPRDAFKMLTAEENLATYSFNTGVAKHHFCRACGVAPFYIPRSDPDKVDVNARCIDGIDLASLRVEKFDGRNWEKSYETYRVERRGDKPEQERQ